MIDFCGRTDNLHYLLEHVGDDGVITSAVREELERLKRRFSRLSQFLEQVENGRIQVIDPDLGDETATRILMTWSTVFGAGEVSSAALAISKRWIFASRDVGPMREWRLREALIMETTQDILSALVRRKVLGKRAADTLMAEVSSSSHDRRRR